MLPGRALQQMVDQCRQLTIINQQMGCSHDEANINILLLLKLPSFGTVMHNASVLSHAQRLRV